MPLSQTVAITCASASQMWFRARWLCLHICSMRKSTQLENLRELPGWAEILQWTRSNWGGGQIWGSCLRRGCALARNTAQKQEAGWGNKVPKPQGWFSDLISEIWDSKSSPFLLPRLHSTVVPVVWDATRASWAILGPGREALASCFCKESDNRYFRICRTAPSQFCHCAYKAIRDGTQMNGGGCMLIKLYL